MLVYKNKKLLSISVGLLAALTLLAAACGSDSSDDDVATTTTTGSSAPTTTSAPAGPVEPSPGPGFDGSTIKLGYLTDTSGGLAIIGVPLKDGSQIYWDYVNNELGGIAGKYQVELVVEDTNDQPATAVQAYQKIKDDVVMFAEILSTGPTNAVLPFLIEDDIIGVPGSLAGQWVLERNLIPNGAPYEYEMINLLDWWHNTRSDGTDVYCSVYVDDLYGQSSIRGYNYAADELNIDIAAEETINRGDTSFVAQLTRLQDAGCTVVGAVTVPVEQSGMLTAALSMGYEPVWLGALPSYLNLLAASGAERYANFYLAIDAPSISNTTVPGMINFNERFDSYGTDPRNSFHLSGYFQSYAVHQLLEKAAEMGDFSREGLLAAAADLGEVDVEGLAGSNFVYGEPSERIPPKASRIFEHDPSVAGDFLNELVIYTSDLIDGFSFN